MHSGPTKRKRLSKAKNRRATSSRPLVTGRTMASSRWMTSTHRPTIASISRAYMHAARLKQQSSGPDKRSGHKKHKRHSVFLCFLVPFCGRSKSYKGRMKIEGQFEFEGTSPLAV